MKRLLLSLALLATLATAGAAQIWTVNTVDDLVWLNANTINTNVFAVSGLASGDGLGALWSFFRSDVTATNTVAKGGPVESVNPVSPAGRWKRVFSTVDLGATNVFNTIIVTNITFANIIVVTNLYMTTNTYVIDGGGTNQVGFIAINPTDGYVPYRSNATTFADSPWSVITTNVVDFNGSGYQFLFRPNNDSFGLGKEALGSGGAIGVENLGFGTRSLQNIGAGIRNYAFAGSALQHVTTGTDNIGIGTSAGNAFLTNFNNVLIGNFAWSSRKGDYNISIGDHSNYGLSDTVTNTIAIGAQMGAVTCVATNSNEVVIGNASNTRIYLPPQIMFGTNVLSYSGTSLTWNGVAITVP